MINKWGRDNGDQDDGAMGPTTHYAYYPSRFVSSSPTSSIFREKEHVPH